MVESLVVLLIVLAAAAYLGLRYYRALRHSRTKTPACPGCGTCDSTEKAAPGGHS